MPGPDATDGNILVRRKPVTVKPPIDWQSMEPAVPGTQLPRMELALNLGGEPVLPRYPRKRTRRTGSSANSVIG